MKHVFALLLAFFCVQAQATTYYISDCQTGADPGCVAGSSGNNGTSTTTPKQTWSQLPTLVSGDNVFFANGGVWSFGSSTINLSVAAASSYTTGVITVDAYSHPSFPNSVKPKLQWTGNFSGFLVSGRGYVLKNLQITNTTSGDSGVKVAFNGSYLKGDNLDISNFSVGAGGDNGGHHLWITNSDIHNNSFGYLADLSNVLLENSLWHANAPSSGNSEHNVYFSGNSGFGGGNVDFTFRNNQVYDQGGMNGLAANNCITSSMTAHGEGTGITIEGNYFYETQQVSDGCTLLELVEGDAENNEGFFGVNIRNNKFVVLSVRSGASFGKMIAVSACVGCVIENNDIVYLATATSNFAGIGVGAGNASDTISSRITIRNNSIYLGAGQDDGSRGISIQGSISGMVVVGNIVMQTSASFSYCYYTTMGSGSFTEWNYNQCYKQGAGGEYSNFAVALSNAQASGFDANGKNTNPLLVATPAVGNGYSMALQSGSPAKNACASSRCARLSFGGTPVTGGTRDIGAYEQ